MALSADARYARRGTGFHNEFGYPVAPGETVYLGSVVGVNASGQVQRLQTAGTEALSIGIADRALNNAGNAAASATPVVILKGTWRIPVPAATAANIGANVYATDDGTFTLNSGAAGAVLLGTLAGIDNGATFVRINGT